MKKPILTHTTMANSMFAETNAVPEDLTEELDRETLLQQAQERVAAGRKLVIYERDTGLFAYWFIALRCEEECFRAIRYDRPLSVVVIEPAPDADTWDATERITKALQDHLRQADLAGYLGNARFTMVLPETNRAGAQTFLDRMRGFVPEIQGGISSCPKDGGTFQELYDAAASGLADNESAARTA